jgi:polyferredoxin
VADPTIPAATDDEIRLLRADGDMHTVMACDIVAGTMTIPNQDMAKLKTAALAHLAEQALLRRVMAP